MINVLQIYAPSNMTTWVPRSTPENVTGLNDTGWSYKLLSWLQEQQIPQKYVRF